MSKLMGDDPDSRLGRVGERVSFGVGFLLMLVVACGALFQRFWHPELIPPAGSVFEDALRVEFFVAMLVCSVVGLTWAVTGSARIEQLSSAAAGKLLLWLAAWLVVGGLASALLRK